MSEKTIRFLLLLTSHSAIDQSLLPLITHLHQYNLQMLEKSEKQKMPQILDVKVSNVHDVLGTSCP